MKKSMMHDEFVDVIGSIRDDAKTDMERELASLLLEMYRLVSWHEPVIQLVNRRALEAMEGTDES